MNLKHVVRNLALKNDWFTGRATPKERIIQFLDSVKPMRTNHQLVRIGGDSDGGYLIPDDLAGIDTCFSPGVSAIAEFEDELTKRGIRCFLADYSVDGPPVQNPLFDFEKKFLGITNDHVFTTLDRWVETKAPGHSDLILQMDIEGSEYPVILDSSESTLRRFRIIVVEFHGLDSLFHPMGWELINTSFAKLLKHFRVVHIHPNNCSGALRVGQLCVPPIMEFTFIRNDRIGVMEPTVQFPHPLDRPNVKTRRDVRLPECWFG